MTSALQLPLSLYLPMIFRTCWLVIFKIVQCWKNWELLALLVLVVAMVVSATRRQRAHSLSRAVAEAAVVPPAMMGGERRQAAAMVLSALFPSIHQHYGRKLELSRTARASLQPAEAVAVATAVVVTATR